MKITLVTRAGPIELDVSPEQSIAGVAAKMGIDLYGECGGEGRCMGCCRKATSGSETLFNKKARARCSESGDPVMIQTCKTIPLEDGAVIDAGETA